MGKPKPFSRPSVSLSDGAKKEWREVRVREVKVGDLVVDYGLVEELLSTSFEDVAVLFASGATVYFDSDRKVTAFVEVAR